MIGYLEAAIKDNPENYENLTKLGLLYGQMGELEKSLEYFERAIEIDSKNPVAYGYLGTLYNSKQEPEKAVEALEKAIELGSKKAIVKRSLAASYFFSEQYTKSISSINQFLTEHPDDFKTKILLGLSYQNINDTNKALATFEEIRQFFLDAGKPETAQAIEDQYIKPLQN